MYKTIDAHMHFNYNTDDPVADLLMQLNDSKLDGCVLILNTKEDKALYRRNEQLLHDCGRTIIVSQLLDIKQDDISDPKWQNIPIIKIHPRLSRITEADIKGYAEALEKMPAHVIIVDCFPYGHNVEYNIGVNMVIYLARRFANKKIVMAHSGGVELLKSVMVTKTLKNVFYDLSLTCNYLRDSSIHLDMVQLLKYHYNRVMYGSDYPDFTSMQAMECINGICDRAALSINERQLVFGENALYVYIKKEGLL